MDLITSDTFMGHDTAQAGGFTGSGILASVCDAGIDQTHPDFGRILYLDEGGGAGILEAAHGAQSQQMPGVWEHGV